MSSRRWSLFVVVALLGLSGCRMCCPSYDYCGPTEPGESNSEYCGMARRGSIFSGAPVYSGDFVEGETIVEGDAVIEEQGEPALMQPPDPPTVQKTTRRGR